MFDVVRLFKKVTRNSGLLIRKYSVGSSEDARLLKQLEHHKINFIFDIGANTGQFALNLIDFGYQGEILSFEPLSAAHKILSDTSRPYSNWSIYEKCALGSENTEMSINVSGNSFSSSLLPMMDSHVKSAPQSAYISKENVKVYRLDDLIGKIDLKDKRPFLKIDVQGFEYEVLKGAEILLEKIIGVQLEVSLVPLYDGTKYFLEDYLKYFKERGFKLVSINPEFTDPHSGTVLQCDATFIRE